jgi:hypothetical protein
MAPTKQKGGSLDDVKSDALGPKEKAGVTGTTQSKSRRAGASSTSTSLKEAGSLHQASKPGSAPASTSQEPGAGVCAM